MPDTAKTTNPWRVFALVTSTILLGTMNFSVVFVAFSTLRESFNAPDATISWALTAFSITLAAAIVPAGWMADRFGRKTTMMTGITSFTIGSGIVATAPNVTLLVVGRVIQAAGLALESSASLAIVLGAFPTDRRSTAVGGMGAVGGAAAAFGPAAGGALVDAIGWRWTFGLNVPAGVLLLVLIGTRLERDAPTPSDGKPDVVGALSLMAGVGSLALGIVQLDEWGGTDWRTLTALIGGAMIIAALVWRSMRVPDPILHLPLYRIPTFRIGSLLNLLIAGTFAGMFFSFVTLLTDGWGLSLSEAGLALAIIPGIGGPLSFLAGRIADRRGSRAVILPGALLLIVAGLMTHYLIGPERAIWSQWMPTAAVFGLGVGFAHAASHSAAMSEVPADRLGIGGAMSRIMLDVGGTISVAIAVVVVTSVDDTVAGVNRVAYMLITASAIGALLATRLPSGAPARVP